MKIGLVESEKGVGTCTEGGEQNRAVLGLGEDEHLVESELSGDESEVGKERGPPVGGGLGAELAGVAFRLLDTVSGR